MIALIAPIAIAAAHLSSSGGDDSAPGWLLALGPAGAAALYTMLYRFYRNNDKRNQFERETKVETKPITGSDRKVNEVRGTRNRRIDGDNVASFRQRVARIPSDPPPPAG